MAELSCAECTHAIPSSADRCPHCARPGLFPNVRAAAQQEEIDALEDRFGQARQDAAGRGADQAVQDFMAALGGSKAVISRPLGEVQRLANSEKQDMRRTTSSPTPRPACPTGTTGTPCAGWLTRGCSRATKTR